VSRPWTTPADIRRKIRRRWDDGSLLCWLAAAEPMPVFDLPVRGPRPAEIGEALAEVRAWIADLDAGGRDGRHYDVVRAPIGGRHFGRNEIPIRARVSSYEQAWRLLGVADQVATYQRVLELSSALPWSASGWPPTPSERCRSPTSGRRCSRRTAGSTGPAARAATCGRSPRLASTRSSSSATGSCWPAAGGRPQRARFAAGLGLAAKPVAVRLRFDPAVLGLPVSLSEGTFRVEELAALPATARTAVIIENETTYLTVPIPDGGVVVWGKASRSTASARFPGSRTLPCTTGATWTRMDSRSWTGFGPGCPARARS
jgi:hypothetical protein